MSHRKNDLLIRLNNFGGTHYLSFTDQTTSGSVLSNQPGTVFGGTSMSYHPCLPSQRTCHLQCRGGYTKGPGGCHFCMCAPKYGRYMYILICTLTAQVSLAGLLIVIEHFRNNLTALFYEK